MKKLIEYGNFYWKISTVKVLMEQMKGAQSGGKRSGKCFVAMLTHLLPVRMLCKGMDASLRGRDRLWTRWLGSFFLRMFQIIFPVLHSCHLLHIFPSNQRTQNHAM